MKLIIMRLMNNELRRHLTRIMVTIYEPAANEYLRCTAKRIRRVVSTRLVRKVLCNSTERERFTVIVFQMFTERKTRKILPLNYHIPIARSKVVGVRIEL